MFGSCVLGVKLWNYFGQVDIIVIFGNFNNRFRVGFYYLFNVFRYIYLFYYYNNYV